MISISLSAAARDIYSLNRGWTFSTGSSDATDRGLLINLPHTWNNDAIVGKSDYFRGEGYYDRQIDIPAEWNGKRLFIRILGSNSVTNFWVNGRHVGEHRGGSSAFTFEITDFVRFGQSNLLRIVANNSPRMDVLPTAGEANCYGGLYRGVELFVTDSFIISPLVDGSEGVWIEQRQVSDRRAEGVVRVALSGTKGVPDQSRVSIQISDADQNPVTDGVVEVTAGCDTVEVPFTIENPTLWQGIENPYLYHIDVCLTAGNRVVDSLSITTGFRNLAIDPKQGFMLNGKPYKLRGAVLHRDRMMAGTALTMLQLEEDFNMLLEMGANAVRIAGGQHSDYFYTLCDTHGIVVWSDGPFEGQSYATDCQFVKTREFAQNGEDQLRETIHQLYNHPSVAFWGIFSKLNYRGDDPTEYVRRLNSLAKTLDPSRITAAVSNQDGNLNFITDAIVFEHSFGWTTESPDDIAVWSEQFRGQWGDKLCAGVSFAAGGSIYHQDSKLSRPQPTGQWHPEGWHTHFHERYMDNLKGSEGFFGIFVTNLFDYGAAGRTYGDGKGINDCGLVTFDRKDKKDAFFLYKALWNTTDPFVHIVGRRYDTRTSLRQTIKVYSNQAEVDLVLNDFPVSSKTGESGIFVWEGLELQPGINRIEARSGWSTDKISIFIEGGTNVGAAVVRTAPRSRTNL